jgi:PAS domain S-box-containing protein
MTSGDAPRADEPATLPPALLTLPTGADLHMIIDMVPHMVWLARPDGTTEYVNRRVVEYVGESTTGPFGWLALVHPEDADRAGRAWTEALGQATPLEVEHRLRRSDGRYRWHVTRGVPLRDGSGAVVRWVGTSTDIQARKALEVRLRRVQRDTAETLTLLETLQSSAPVGFGFADRDGRFLRVNETLAALGGVPVDQHLGRPIAEVFPAFWPWIEPAYRRVLDTGRAVLRQEVVLPTRDGSLGSWLASFYPVRVGGGVVGVGLVVDDVTEHRQALQFRSVVMDHIADGLYTTDAEGRLTSVNRAGAAMLGWSEADLVGRPAHEVLHPNHPDGTAEDCPLAHRPVAEDEDDVRVSDAGTFVRKDGNEIQVAYSAAPLRLGSTGSGTVVVFRDDTAQRQRQQREVEERHDQKMESLGRLSAGLAHEINTPIQFVGDNTRFLAEAYQTMLELLLVYRECMGPSSGNLSWQERNARAEAAEEKADIEYLAAEVPAAVEQSLEGMERVASLVRAMKAFSYKDVKERTYTDLNDAIRTTVTVARNEVKYVADVVLDLGELPEVLCYRGDLNQVFLNLLVNAADAMQGRDGRGEVRVTTRAENGTAVISFADNGTGIPEEIQKTIFEPFFTTKEVGKGTGQGLALARAVCDKHGGSIEVHSTVGVGTEFVLRLPVAGKA